MSEETTDQHGYAADLERRARDLEERVDRELMLYGDDEDPAMFAWVDELTMGAENMRRTAGEIRAAPASATRRFGDLPEAAAGQDQG